MLIENLAISTWPLALSQSKTGLNSGVTLRKSFRSGVAGRVPPGCTVAEIARHRNVMARDRKTEELTAEDAESAEGRDQNQSCSGHQTSTSRSREKCSRGGVAGSWIPADAAMVLTLITASASCKGHGGWWM